MEDMYQGFWCFWNRSPGDLPTDKTAHPPSYPELFDYPMFLTNPNPSDLSSCGNCLFWCTALILKAYEKGGVPILNTLWVPTMYDDFKSRDKLVLAHDATSSNIVSGSVVFFQVQGGSFPNIPNHVGIVYKVDANGLVFLQSNAGTKTGSLSLDSGGAGNLPGITTVAFGLP